MKLSFMRYILALLLFTVFTTAYATADADLSNLLNSLRSIRANFTQTVYDNHGKTVQKSYGHMALQRPGKFRWEIKKPIPQVIIANQTRLWIYDSDLQQVTIKALHRAAGETPALLLSHEDTQLNNDFSVIEIKKNTPGWRWFELTPKSSDNMFASVQMGFMNKQIHEMRLKDHLGHTTKIEFSNAETNINLAPSLFNFKAPAGVDVIDETRKKR